MIRGEGSAFIPGATAQDVFDFVLDPDQYRKADTKVVAVTKLADTPDGMLAREDGRFLGRLPGSVVNRYRWDAPRRIDVSIEHGLPKQLHAWFDIEDRDGGAFVHHVETIAMPAPMGWVWDRVAGPWLARAVEREVSEIARLMAAGERGRGIGAHGA